MEIYKDPTVLPQDILILKTETDKLNNIPHLTDIIGGCYLLDWHSKDINNPSQIIINSEDEYIFSFIKNQKQIQFLLTNLSILRFFNKSKSSNQFDTKIVIYGGIEYISGVPIGFDKLGLDWVTFNYTSKKIINLEDNVNHNTAERLRLEFDRENKLKKLLD